MNDFDNAMSRRSFIANAIVLPGLAGFLIAETATAQAKGSKAQFKYQNSPKNGQKCAQCTFFVPGKTASANGSCKIVDGSISPNGWCTAWSKKS